ncbi:MAG: glutathione S-transferase family protein [Alphaproteobacteria bacterium]|nr:glutathione S-transferase family protein [Alphaproteobacteria bacterium]
MAVILYDLVGADGRRFSSNCWRTQMALAHKGLDYETVPTRFTDIAQIGDGSFKTIPVIDDRGTWVGDSWTIAEYLDDTYADRPPVLGGSDGHQHALFVQNWARSQIQPLVMTMIVEDIYAQLDPADKEYFHTTRSKRLGRDITGIQEGREERVAEVRARMEPMRLVVAETPFLGGELPTYADYVALSPFIWARTVSPFALVEAGDPVHAWFQRILDLYDGLARRNPGYDW